MYLRSSLWQNNDSTNRACTLVLGSGFLQASLQMYGMSLSARAGPSNLAMISISHRVSKAAYWRKLFDFSNAVQKSVVA